MLSGPCPICCKRNCDRHSLKQQREYLGIEHDPVDSRPIGRGSIKRSHGGEGKNRLD